MANGVVEVTSKSVCYVLHMALLQGTTLCKNGANCVDNATVVIIDLFSPSIQVLHTMHTE